MNDAHPLRETPLAALHEHCGARWMPFAGWRMSAQYAPGALAEHRHCRVAASLFDVSHMGQILLHGSEVPQALESLSPTSLLKLRPGRQTYSLLLNQDGGIVDDCMMARLKEDVWWLIVNASRTEEDWKLLQELEAGFDVRAERLAERALIALQGPQARQVLGRLTPEATDMYFNDLRELSIASVPCWVACSGYTGEDGFEISCASDQAEHLAKALLEHEEVEPAGLVARDSLRLEAGLCLYGADMDDSVSPVEAGLRWLISASRRSPQGSSFPGSQRVLTELASAPFRERIGLVSPDRTPVRSGALLWPATMPLERANQLLDDWQPSDTASIPQELPQDCLGIVTSGSFSPALSRPIAMALAKPQASWPATDCYAVVRGKQVRLQVQKMPVVPARQRRKPSVKPPPKAGS